MKKKRWSPRKAKMTKMLSYVSGIQADQFKVKLRWMIVDDITLGALGTYNLQFSGNSPYDPDYSGVGVSSFLWTWCSTLYNKYMCSYSKIKVRILPAGGQQTTDYGWIKRSLNQADPVTIEDYYGQPYGKVKHQVFSALSEPKEYVFTDRCSTSKMLGRKMDPSIDRVDKTADPNEEWVYSLTLFNSINQSKNYRYIAYMTFWVTWSDRELISV